MLDRSKLPAGLPGASDEPLHLTFATDSVEEMLANWAAHLRRLQLPAVIAAMDAAVLDVCPRLGVHCLAAFDEASESAMRAEAARLGGDTVNIRGNPGLFNSLGGRKVAAILDLLHASGRAVLVSDVDVVWLSDPKALVTGRLKGYEDFAHADILGSTDCLDPSLDVSDHGCYNVLMDRNTGVLVVRNTTAARATMEEWRERTRGDGTSPRAWETDQTAFDDLLRGRGRGHRRNMTDPQRRDYFEMKKDWCGFPKGIAEDRTMGSLSELGGRHTEGSRRLFDVCVPRVARALRFGLLPLALVANGHSFFVQQLQLQTGVWPHAVHATYQFEDQADCAFGKRERLREWGMWLADAHELRPWGGAADARLARVSRGGCAPPLEEVAAAAEARLAAAEAAERFLILDDDVGAADALAPVVPWVPSDPHARGRQHVAHLERARQRLADGVLLARVLNRTVVLPQFHCYCDKYWARLTQCTIGTQVLGSQPLPFVCPLDHVIPVSGWYGNWAARKARGRRCAPARADGPPTHGFPYRTHGWLATAARRPHLARVGGTLVPTNASADGGRGAVVGWRRTHDGVELAAAGEASRLRAARRRARCATARGRTPCSRRGRCSACRSPTRARCCAASILTRGPSSSSSFGCTGAGAPRGSARARRTRRRPTTARTCASGGSRCRRRRRSAAI